MVQLLKAALVDVATAGRETVVAVSEADGKVNGEL
jgi:hypothetical protein